MPREFTQPPDVLKPRPRNVFLVEEHPIYRLGLSALIEAEEDLAVCGVARDAISALGALRGVEADAVVLEISLPGPDGLELLKGIKSEHQEMRVLVLSKFDERTYASRCLRSGASGYLMKKEADGPKFVCALRKVLEGEISLSGSFERQLVRHSIHGEIVMNQTPLGILSDRELEILHHVGDGRSTAQIASLLHLSTKTVESHRLHLKEKLQIKDAGALVEFAVQWVEWQTFGGMPPAYGPALAATPTESPAAIMAARIALDVDERMTNPCVLKRSTLGAGVTCEPSSGEET